MFVSENFTWIENKRKKTLRCVHSFLKQKQRVKINTTTSTLRQPIIYFFLHIFFFSFDCTTFHQYSVFTLLIFFYQLKSLFCHQIRTLSLAVIVSLVLPICSFCFQIFFSLVYFPICRFELYRYMKFFLFTIFMYCMCELRNLQCEEKRANRSTCVQHIERAVAFVTHLALNWSDCECVTVMESNIFLFLQYFAFSSFSCHFFFIYFVVLPLIFKM